MAVDVGPVVAAAHTALRAQVARIDSLNVFPVPDGDTGTNMLLTLDSMLKETSGSTYEDPVTASRAVARAALMGARGNSGVILSQMVKGACDVLATQERLTAETFAAAIDGARERAYASVRQPVEGTMLTVVKDAARAAREALAEDPGLPAVMRAAARAAHTAAEEGGQHPGVLPVHLRHHPGHLPRVVVPAARELAAQLAAHPLLEQLGELGALVGVHAGEGLLRGALVGVGVNVLGDAPVVVVGLVVGVALVDRSLLEAADEVLGVGAPVVVVAAPEEPLQHRIHFVSPSCGSRSRYPRHGTTPTWPRKSIGRTRASDECARRNPA